MFKRHDVLEIPAIPRERDKFNAIIGAARFQKRKSNLIHFAVYNLLIWSVIILMMRAWPVAPARAVPLRNRTNSLFLPVVMTHRINSIHGVNQ